VVGIDRFTASDWAALEAAVGQAPPRPATLAAPPAPSPTSPPGPPPRPPGWLGPRRRWLR
jgi:hypothetical protein